MPLDKSLSTLEWHQVPRKQVITAPKINNVNMPFALSMPTYDIRTADSWARGVRAKRIQKQGPASLCRRNIELLNGADLQMCVYLDAKVMQCIALTCLSSKVIATNAFSYLFHPFLLELV